MFFDMACINEAGRRQENQDSLCYMTADNEKTEIVCAAVCDGMGGLRDGGRASSEVIRAVNMWFDDSVRKRCFTNREAEHSLENMVTEAGQKLRERGESGGFLMGTTCTVFWVCGNRYRIMNIGDTRVYRIRGGSCSLLTEDHTLAMREVKAGRMSSEDAEKSPLSSVLLRCVGGREESSPDFFRGTAKEGDCYLVCSDGFRRLLSGKEIAEALGQDTRGNDGLKAGIRQLAAYAFIRGESDNMTAVAVRIRGGRPAEETVWGQ